MEAGYDYLLSNRNLRRIRLAVRKIRENPLPYAGAALIVLGLTGVLIGSLFFFVFEKSSEELEDELAAVASSAPQPRGELSQARESTPEPGSPVGPASPVTVVFPAQPASAQPASAQPASAPVTELSPNLASQAGLFPGENLKSDYWSESTTYEPAAHYVALDGFTKVDPADLGQLPAPTRLLIPSIDVKSDVRQLRVLNLGTSVSWETPDNVVGHIPVTANPGEAGSAWMFGHLESPIRGEGNVFGKLPEIPAMLRRGDDVYAVVENGSDQYLYRIVESKVVPQDELSMTDDGTAQLLMVTCVPRFVYDHRLVVRAVLEGVKS